NPTLCGTQGDVAPVADACGAHVGFTRDRARGCREGRQVHRVGLGYEDDDVRIADARAVCLTTVDADRLWRRGRAQRDGDALAFAAGAHIAADKTELDAVTTMTIEEVPGDAACPVAAGFAEGTVRVVKRHEPAPALLPSDRADTN